MKIGVAILREYVKEILKEKTFADFGAPKGTLVSLSPSDFRDEDRTPGVRNLNDEIYELIQNAYSDVPLGNDKFGNIKVQSPDDLPAGYTMMNAADIDADPEPDYFRGGKMRGGRYKMGIVGHDGSAAALQKYLDETAKELLSGAIAEMSGKIATIMITRYGVPAVTDHETVESMLGKPVTWIGKHPSAVYAKKYGPDYEGFYSRGISGPGKDSAGGNEHVKILLGGV